MSKLFIGILQNCFIVLATYLIYDEEHYWKFHCQTGKRESMIKSHMNMKETCCGYGSQIQFNRYIHFFIPSCFTVCMYVCMCVQFALIKRIIHGRKLIDSSIFFSRLVFPIILSFMQSYRMWSEHMRNMIHISSFQPITFI